MSNSPLFSKHELTTMEDEFICCFWINDGTFTWEVTDLTFCDMRICSAWGLIGTIKPHQIRMNKTHQR